jgi:hypothetical protein
MERGCRQMVAARAQDPYQIESACDSMGCFEPLAGGAATW